MSGPKRRKHLGKPGAGVSADGRPVSGGTFSADQKGLQDFDLLMAHATGRAHLPYWDSLEQGLLHRWAHYADTDRVDAAVELMQQVPANRVDEIAAQMDYPAAFLRDVGASLIGTRIAQAPVHVSEDDWNALSPSRQRSLSVFIQNGGWGSYVTDESVPEGMVLVGAPRMRGLITWDDESSTLGMIGVDVDESGHLWPSEDIRLVASEDDSIPDTVRRFTDALQDAYTAKCVAGMLPNPESMKVRYDYAPEGGLFTFSDPDTGISGSWKIDRASADSATEIDRLVKQVARTVAGDHVPTRDAVRRLGDSLRALDARAATAAPHRVGVRAQSFLDDGAFMRLGEKIMSAVPWQLGISHALPRPTAEALGKTDMVVSLFEGTEGVALLSSRADRALPQVSLGVNRNGRIAVRVGHQLFASPEAARDELISRSHTGALHMLDWAEENVGELALFASGMDDTNGFGF